jgi:hypothetical protein
VVRPALVVRKLGVLEWNDARDRAVTLQYQHGLAAFDARKELRKTFFACETVALFIGPS